MNKSAGRLLKIRYQIKAFLFIVVLFYEKKSVMEDSLINFFKEKSYSIFLNLKTINRL